MQVNLLGFYRISEAIGGVRVCLLHAQNAHTETDGVRPGYSGINLPEGVSTIKGAQALAFVRQRHGLPHGDLDRIRRQQYFLDAAFHKIASSGVLLNPFKLHDLLAAVSSSLLTDPTLNLLSLARSFELLSAGEISFQTLPNNGPQLIYPDGVETSIVEVDPRRSRASSAQSWAAGRLSVVQAPARRGHRRRAERHRHHGLATRNAAARSSGWASRSTSSTRRRARRRPRRRVPARARRSGQGRAAVVPGAKLIETARCRGSRWYSAPTAARSAASRQPRATPARHTTRSSAATAAACIN